jgi:LmbE family N-acetylglucosaminyl deacetylase
MMKKTILVVAAHPDDEVLGCGGTIARHTAYGDKVHVIFMTNGVSSRNVSNKEIKDRQIAAQNAADILGILSIEYFEFPDNKMDSIPLLDIVQSIEDVIKKLQPEIIYTHHIGDLNIDHQITHKAVITACRPTPETVTQEIYTFEVMSSTDWSPSAIDLFHPNYYIEIGNYENVKLAALNAYNVELRKTPHSRSLNHIKALAVYRGNSIGVGVAEAFMVVRKLVKN